MAKDRVIGIDLGGTKLLAGVFDTTMKLLGSKKNKTPGTSNGDTVKDLMITMVKDLLAETGIELASVIAIGIAVPGPIDMKTGVILDTPNIGFKNYPLRDLMQRALKVPVFLENDANAGVYGEYSRGVAKGYSNIIGVFPGSGLGGGLICDGRLYRGSKGSAGEIGHMRVQDGGRLCGCGRYGCLESIASKNALARDIVALAATGKAPTIAAEAGTDYKLIRSGLIKKSIKAGEAEVAQLVKRAAKYLGIGMANLVNIFDPELIVLGGGLIEKLSDEIVPVAEASMRDHAHPNMADRVKVAIAELGDDAVMSGAAALALEQGGV